MSKDSKNRVVWPCEQAQQTADAKYHTQRSQKNRKIIQFTIPFLAGTLFVFVLKHVWLGAIIYTLSGLILVGGLFIPSLDKLFQQVGLFMGKAAGTLLAYVLLIPFFYLCFLPGRLILLWMGKDPMCRQMSSDEKTYWLAKAPSEDRQRYRKLY